MRLWFYIRYCGAVDNNRVEGNACFHRVYLGKVIFGGLILGVRDIRGATIQHLPNRRKRVWLEVCWSYAMWRAWRPAEEDWQVNEVPQPSRYPSRWVVKFSKIGIGRNGATQQWFSMCDSRSRESKSTGILLGKKIQRFLWRSTESRVQLSGVSTTPSRVSDAVWRTKTHWRTTGVGDYLANVFHIFFFLILKCYVLQIVHIHKIV